MVMRLLTCAVSDERPVLILRWPPYGTASIPSANVLNGFGNVPNSGKKNPPGYVKSTQVSPSVSHSTVMLVSLDWNGCTWRRVVVGEPSSHRRYGVVSSPCQALVPPRRNDG